MHNLAEVRKGNELLWTARNADSPDTLRVLLTGFISMVKSTVLNTLPDFT